MKNKPVKFLKAKVSFQHLLSKKMKLLMQNITNFFQKIVGTLFFPTKTIEGLVNEAFSSAILYTGVLSLFFIVVKILLQSLRNTDALVFLHLIGTIIDPFTMSATLVYGNSIVFVGFYFLSFLFYLVISILTCHAIILTEYGLHPSTGFRIEPRIIQTSIILLDCTAPLFIFGCIPGIGLWIGLMWFVIISSFALNAHYGEIQLGGGYFTRHYPCISGFGANTFGAISVFFWFLIAYLINLLPK